MTEIKEKKVILAMSGGVDSSVAAYLLKKQGYKVVGLHLRLFKDGEKEKRIKKIAKAIGIPLVIKDAKKEFKKKVIDYFLREYKEGRTPNPCVVCNREIKFKFLFGELLKLKADYISTGHYARIISNFPASTSRRRGEQFPTRLPDGQVSNKIPKSKLPITNYQLQNHHLFSAKDKTKDQSYFLYILTQKQLAKILFPLGNYKKEEVKKIARNLKLPVSEEESQSACFIAERCPDEFLKRNIKMKPGNIIEINGNKVGRQKNIIGRHIGLPLYTIGQRRNIRIGGTGPYYVIGKDLKKNELLAVKNFNNPLLYKRELLLGSSTPKRELSSQVNWIAGEPKFPLKAKICIRYHHPAVRAIIKPEVRPLSTKAAQRGRTSSARSYLVKFSKPQRAVTPGQAAVIYSEKGEVLGGGIIN